MTQAGSFQALTTEPTSSAGPTKPPMMVNALSSTWPVIAPMNTVTERPVTPTAKQLRVTTRTYFRVLKVRKRWNRPRRRETGGGCGISSGSRAGSSTRTCAGTA